MRIIFNMSAAIEQYERIAATAPSADKTDKTETTFRTSPQEGGSR